MVSLRPIAAANRAAVEALRVAPGQERFVSSVARSMQEALDEPDARPVHWAVYDGETPVGFVMIDDTVDGPFPPFLWKLLIDARYQRRGHGTAVLDLVAAHFRDRGAAVLATSAGQGPGSPIAFYERYGFVRTGEVVGDGEVVLRLDLREPSGS